MISIILPSYNESESICSTIDEIMKILRSNKISYEIIVADDNSPDKTWKIVQDRYASNKNIRVLRRLKDRGLSLAVLDGFSKAKGDMLFVMDADGQHDPIILPKMVKALKQNDLVVGSRYIKGGGVGNWSKRRIAISKFASYLAYPFMGKNKILDPMAGFFGIKKSVLKELDVDVKEYKILLALILAAKRKLKIKEIPYTFRTRTAGESKLGFKVMIDYVLMLIKFFISSNKEFIKFAIVGAIGTVINLGIMYLCVDIWGLIIPLSSAIAVEVSIINNFFFNNFWTFNQRKTNSTLFSRLLKFNLVSLISLGITVGIASLLTMYTNIWYLLAQAIGILIGFVSNYIFNHKWVFKK